MSDVLPRTLNAIREGIDGRLHPGAQVYVWRGGHVLAEAAVGEARPGVAMTVDHLVPWMSNTKPLVAAAILQCAERGRLELDDPVARHVPEFAQHGKQAITIRHLLTHTAGLRQAARHGDDRAWEQIISDICAAVPEWPVGEQAGYHVVSTWYLLGEIVQRIDGRPIDRYLRQEIFEPLGMSDSWLALDRAQVAAVGDRLAMTYRTDGRSMEPQTRSVDPDELGRVRPAAGARGPARELGRFYRTLLGGGMLEGARALSEASVRAMTSRQRVGMLDQTFRQVMDWGLGVIINSAHLTPLQVLPYNFGPGASRDAFGHGGAQSSIAFADPAADLVVVLVFNGMPGEPKHHKRMQAVLAALWDDLADAVK